MSSVDLGPDSVLRLKTRRVLQREVVGPEGLLTLRVFYGEHQITFEADTLSFGRGLVRQSSFRAAEACAWSDGPPRRWDDVRALLIELVASGILELDGHPLPLPEEPPTVLQRVDREAPMPPLRWRSLADLCALTAAENHTLAVDALEATMGAGLLAQLVRDPSGRQCGENSLAMLAPALTDPVPTDWRPCRFAGSRFEDARPMNVSGLKQVAADFDGMLGRIGALRAAFLARLGRHRLDLGSMWLLSWIFFVLPAWVARRAMDPCTNGSVPEWATSLSKTFGGIRMTLQLLLVREGREVGAELTPAELIRVTEEEARYISHTGVCAGTPAMIERTTSVFVSGGCPFSTQPIPEPELALDYGLATAALALVAAAREARTRRLVAAAGIDSPSITRELADVEYREGDPSVVLQRVTELARIVGVSIDCAAPPLCADVPLPHPHADLLLAVLGIEAEAVRLAAHYQGRVNDALGVSAPPALTRRDVALGLAPTSRCLWGDRLAAHLGWTIDENEEGLALRVAGRCIRLRSHTPAVQMC